MNDEYPIDADSVGMRIDQFVAGCIANFSRSRLTLAIRAGHIRCQDKTVAPAYRLREGDRVVCDMAAVEELIADSTEQWSPRKLENADFAVLHADEHLLVIDKPPGIAVHPGAGHHSDTLANHLLHEYPELSAVARAGIVHRLDLDTSGLLVVARSEASRTALIAGFADRSISRSYRALVVGAIARESETDEPIGRHRTRRTLMAVRADGRPAITKWKVSRRFADRAGKKVAELDVRLETGRTHQIRVHTAYAGHPVLGDASYATSQIFRNLAVNLGIERQMLHAYQLRFTHPVTGAAMSFESELPCDYRAAVKTLEGEGIEPKA